MARALRKVVAQAPKDMNAAITAYYDSLSDEELEDDKRWGEFAESQLDQD